MAAGEWNITIEQGADWVRTLTWHQGDDDTTPVVNLTGYTARMKIKPKVIDTPLAAATAVATLTTENGGISLGGALGTIRLALTAAQTAALTPSTKLVYDLELVAAGGTVTRLLQGRATVTPEVTS